MSYRSLSALQVEASRLFFTLPDSHGFAVAGGAALIARGLIARPTKDIDLFLLETGTATIGSAADAFENAMTNRGWSHTRLIDQRDFVRLSISDGNDSLIIDIGRDSPATEATANTDLGPTLSARDLAARKALALFGRAEARDFTDVYALAQRYGRDRLLDWAADDDHGFDRQIFAGMLATIDRIADDELPADAGQASLVRAYMHDWAAELDAALTRPRSRQAVPDPTRQEPEHG
jgi:Nucleotidyl transferase AbiEii toxin, Type IV TA system